VEGTETRGAQPATPGEGPRRSDGGRAADTSSTTHDLAAKLDESGEG
jgi:hypothetical protein